MYNVYMTKLKSKQAELEVVRHKLKNLNDDLDYKQNQKQV